MLQLNRKPGESFTIKPGKGMDLSLPVGEVFSGDPDPRHAESLGKWLGKNRGPSGFANST